MAAGQPPAAHHFHRSFSKGWECLAWPRAEWRGDGLHERKLSERKVLIAGGALWPGGHGHAEKGAASRNNELSRLTHGRGGVATTGHVTGLAQAFAPKRHAADDRLGRQRERRLLSAAGETAGGCSTLGHGRRHELCLMDILHWDVSTATSSLAEGPHSARAGPSAPAPWNWVDGLQSLCGRKRAAEAHGGAESRAALTYSPLCRSTSRPVCQSAAGCSLCECRRRVAWRGGGGGVAEDMYVGINSRLHTHAGPQLRPGSARDNDVASIVPLLPLPAPRCARSCCHPLAAHLSLPCALLFRD